MVHGIGRTGQARRGRVIAELLELVGLTAALRRPLDPRTSSPAASGSVIGIARALAAGAEALVVCGRAGCVRWTSRSRAQVDQPAAGPAAAAWRGLPVRRARSGGGAPRRGPGGRDVSRASSWRSARKARKLFAAIRGIPTRGRCWRRCAATQTRIAPRARILVVGGEVPSPSADVPPGCRFHTRCPVAQPVCRVEIPMLRNVAPNHQAACHFAAPFPIPIA